MEPAATTFSFDLLTDGSLVLTLNGACIQSTARHAHRELTGALLDGRLTADVADASLKLLVTFLETTDFAALRAAHPELNGERRCRVRLHRGADGAVCWELVSW